MRRILYVSTADMLDDGIIGDILKGAAQHNQQTGISGFLLYNGRNFLQLIEGGDAAIGSLMDRIEVDPRHDGVARLYDAAIGERCTPDWSMHRVLTGQQHEQRMDGLRAVLPQLDEWTTNLVSNFAQLN